MSLPNATSTDSLIEFWSTCKRCKQPKQGSGLCKACTSDVLRGTSAVKDTRVGKLQQEKIGPQTSFIVMALVVFPVAFAASIVGSVFLHPHYTFAQTLLSGLLMANCITFTASWLVLFFSAAQQDVVSAILSLRSFTRLYRHADHFWKTAPRLFMLHLGCLACTILLGFTYIVSGTFSIDEVASMTGQEIAYEDCSGEDCYSE